MLKFLSVTSVLQPAKVRQSCSATDYYYYNICIVPALPYIMEL
jgi:hypothetical protein